MLFQVVRCSSDSCGSFQVQQFKKSSKWVCILCGEKQSLRRVFFESQSAKECRPIVQEFNLRRGQQQQQQREQQHQQQEQEQDVPICRENDPLKKTPSRWDDYNDPQVTEEEDDSVQTEFFEVEAVQKSRKRRRRNSIQPEPEQEDKPLIVSSRSSLCDDNDDFDESVLEIVEDY